jgi:hypothetical protein
MGWVNWGIMWFWWGRVGRGHKCNANSRTGDENMEWKWNDVWIIKCADGGCRRIEKKRAMDFFVHTLILFVHTFGFFCPHLFFGFFCPHIWFFLSTTYFRFYLSTNGKAAFTMHPSVRQSVSPSVSPSIHQSVPSGCSKYHVALWTTWRRDGQTERTDGTDRRIDGLTDVEFTMQFWDFGFLTTWKYPFSILIILENTLQKCGRIE